MAEQVANEPPVEAPIDAPTEAPVEGAWNPRLALLLAAAMFVLVVDTSLMNVSISAVVHDTPPGYTSPWVLAGHYTVKLIVDGKTYTQPMTIRMDPRVKTPVAGIDEQYKVSMELYDGMVETSAMLSQIHGLKDQINQRKAQTPKAAAGDALDAFEKQLEALEGQREGLFALFRGTGNVPESLMLVRFQLSSLLGMGQQADAAPTAPQAGASPTSSTPGTGVARPCHSGRS